MSSPYLDLLGGQYLLRALGFESADFESGLSRLSGQPQVLSDLRDQFSSCAGPMGGRQGLASLLEHGVPAQSMPPPNMEACPCQRQYAMPQMPFGLGMPVRLNLKDLFGSKRKAKRFERLLRQDPFLRAQVEMMLGGRIIADEKNDGKIRIQPFAGGAVGGGEPQAMAVLASLAGVQQAGMQAAFVPGMSSDQAYHGMMLGALAQTYQGPALGGGPPQGGALRPSPNGPHQPRFGIAPGGNDEVTAVLNDPSLTVEDKVTLMIMLIMKKMDKDIEKQAQYINSLQQQQSGGGQGGFPGAAGAGAAGQGGGSSPSIDVETMKLKRLIDKRSQMFDMLRQIIDKYNQTAKGIIDSMGR